MPRSTGRDDNDQGTGQAGLLRIRLQLPRGHERHPGGEVAHPATKAAVGERRQAPWSGRRPSARPVKPRTAPSEASSHLAGVSLASGFTAGAYECPDCGPGHPRGSGGADRIEDVLLSDGALLHGSAQERYRFCVLLVAGRRLVLLKAGGELVGVLEDLLNGSRHMASLKESLPGAHGMHDVSPST